MLCVWLEGEDWNSVFIEIYFFYFSKDSSFTLQFFVIFKMKYFITVQFSYNGLFNFREYLLLNYIIMNKVYSIYYLRLYIDYIHVYIPVLRRYIIA